MGSKEENDTERMLIDFNKSAMFHREMLESLKKMGKELEEILVLIKNK